MSPLYSPGVLVLEDDPGLGELIRKRLERDGLKVVVAQNAAQAFERLENTPNIEIAICDYNLGPREDNGLEVFKKLSKQRKSLSAILITGIATEKQLIEGIRLGIRDFVPKNDEFLETLSFVLENLVEEKTRDRRLKETEIIAGYNQGSRLALDAADLFWINWEVAPDKVTVSERLIELSPSLAEAETPRDLLHIIHKDQRREVMLALASARSNPQKIVETEFKIADRTPEVWVRARGKFLSGIGRSGQFLVILFDETETKQRELELKELNKISQELAARLSRSMLEIHHRVKNSFQIVISLLNMELRNKGMLERVDVERVVSYLQGLAVIHDMLTDQAKSQDADGLVDITTLIRNIALVVSPSIDRIKLNLADSNAVATPRAASSIAVVVTELILNALKYSSDKEQIEISLTTDDEGCEHRFRIKNQLATSDTDNAPNTNIPAGTGHALISFLVKSDLDNELETILTENSYEATFCIPVKTV